MLPAEMLRAASRRILLWTGVGGTLSAGPFTLRQHIRRKRGLCVKCKYDLRGSLRAVCPDCGWGREDAS